ncbi:Lrp/AsnC family transcriptional regulator [Sulfolobus sp. E11-6]|uniref:Lrp/AsnC family transcriptional regulator n=1 Tax=Sulfolobus sp. E11-6 TaxID=2663020 RepID=UPI0012961196|nr:winged helix-turn-helix transcriptional regulator [Sulfolobus sp. E11-6]QGA68551.1 winged helix-turn-helix transcriptional regulator [Sulfolobus sp. E11-6]
MDEIDKKIIVELFRGNTSLRHISKVLKISHQAVHYRLKTHIKNGILKGFSIYINPNVLGYLHSFIIIKGYDHGYDLPYVTSKFLCIEGYTIYEVIGKSEKELEENKKRILTLTKGEKFMEINVNKNISINNIDKQIIHLLKFNQKIDLGELSLKLNLNKSKISNKIKKLFNSGLIKKFL